MYKLLSVILLLHGVFAEINDIENATITREIRLSQPYTTTIANNSHLITLSANKTHLRIDSTDEHFRSCVIAVDPVEHSLQGKLRAKILASKIIVWGLRSRHSNESATKVNYTILITNPINCTYKPLSTLEEVLMPYWPKRRNSKVAHDKCSYNPPSSADEIFPRSWLDEHLPQLVVAHDNQNTLDVFYPSLAICAPCRYTIDSGARINLDRRIKPETPRPELFTRIEAFDWLGQHERGYFYANGFRNGSAVMKLLDRDFNVVKGKFIKHSVDVAAGNAAFGISICYMTSQPFPYHSYIFGSNGKSANRIFCERFDDNLELKFSTELVLPDKVEPKALTLNVDSSGNSFVSVQFSNLNQEDIITVYRVDSAGLVTNKLNLRQVKNVNSNYWKSRGILADNQFCLEITHQPSNSTTTPHDWLKCIAI